MSLFQDSRYQWRETYFILIDPSRRPTFASLREALLAIGESQLEDPSVDENGRFESVTLFASDGISALELSFVQGEEVVECRQDLIRDLKSAACETDQEELLRRVARYDARIDVLHFQSVGESEWTTDELDDEEMDEIVDPGTLLLVLGVIAQATNGVAIDPQSGSILSD